MIFIGRCSSIRAFTIMCCLTILLVADVDAGSMMGGGKKGHGGSSGVEAMLVAGILAKLLGSNNEKSSAKSHPMYIPMPMVYHTMGGGMGGHSMMGGYGMMGGGGYGMGGHGGMSW